MGEGVVGTKMSWVEKNREINNRGTIIRDTRVLDVKYVAEDCITSRVSQPMI